MSWFTIGSIKVSSDWRYSVPLGTGDEIVRLSLRPNSNPNILPGLICQSFDGANQGIKSFYCPFNEQQIFVFESLALPLTRRVGVRAKYPSNAVWSVVLEKWTP
ncbi:hypothetical protein DO97_17455 [Neosynechococcus sphagnicola sy1]|uniref:Uncharacterized protein n=1 Tax=Neosynechococcus sphagnicola sy1 TaxID=1497020 RepID=A0A098TLA3_9CYAN|nr:hypothetical protein DO97_17455 [Neosynechococcus sphagnicola sy1]